MKARESRNHRPRHWAVLAIVLLVALVGCWYFGTRRRIVGEWEFTGNSARILGALPDGRVAVHTKDGLDLIEGGTRTNAPGVWDMAYWSSAMLFGTNGILVSEWMSQDKDNRSYIKWLDWSGRELWAFSTNGLSGRQVIDGATNIYFVGPNWSICSLDSNGNLRWTAAYFSSVTNRWSDRVPAVSKNGMVAMVGSPADGLFVLNNDGSILWRDSAVNGMPNQTGTSFAPNGDLIVRKGWDLIRYDPTGRRIWVVDLGKAMGTSKPAPPTSRSPICRPDGTIYGSLSRWVFAVSSDGKLRWKHALSGTDNLTMQRGWGADWATFTPEGNLVTVAAESYTNKVAGVMMKYDVAENERLICLSPAGNLLWEQNLPSANFQNLRIQRSWQEMRILWRTRFGRRQASKYLHDVTIVPDGTVYVAGSMAGKIKIWAIRGD